MPTQLFHLDAIEENPWNERPLDQENVDQIATSILTDGLLQNPVGRPKPGDPARVQLAYGHHRLAAFRQLLKTHPGEGFEVIPVEIRAIDDLAMARQAIVENHSRKDPSAIEKARAMLRLVTELGQTQAQAGEVFGLGQSNVAHLLGMLKLPDDVQALVNAGALAEVAARYLVPLVKWDPAVVSKIAERSQKVDPDDRTEWIKREIGIALSNKAKQLSNAYYTPWPLDWPAKPMPAPAGLKGNKDVPDELPACKGCKFALERGDQKYCLREACHDAKAKAYPAAAVELASKKLGIPAAGEGEKVTVIWSGGYNSEQRRKVEKAMRAGRPELRLVPIAKGERDHSGNLREVTGSSLVCLAATNVSTLNAWLDESKGKPVKIEKPKNETAAQKERRINGERELAEERAHERSQFNKARADGAWLFDKAAQLVAENTVAAGGLLVFAAQHVSVQGVEVSELRAAVDALGDAAKLGREADYAGERHGKAAPATPELDLTRRKYIALTELVKRVAAYQAPAKLYDKFDGVVRDLAKTALDSFSVTLPAGWDSVPVHHTAYNCWTCGAFAGNPKGLTQGELKQGWGGDDKAGYHCPLHAPSKRLVNILAADSPALEDVRGHAPMRPAPKPSAAKKPASKPVGVSTGRPSRAAQQRAQAAKPAGKGGRK